MLAEQANIKIQRTGAVVTRQQSQLLPAADLERYAALNATPPRLHYQDVRTRLLLRDGLEYRFAT